MSELEQGEPKPPASTVGLILKFTFGFALGYLVIRYGLSWLYGFINSLFR